MRPGRQISALHYLACCSLGFDFLQWKELANLNYNSIVVTLGCWNFLAYHKTEITKLCPTPRPNKACYLPIKFYWNTAITFITWWLHVIIMAELSTIVAKERIWCTNIKYLLSNLLKKKFLTSAIKEDIQKFCGIGNLK